MYENLDTNQSRYFNIASFIQFGKIWRTIVQKKTSIRYRIEIKLGT